MLGYVMICILGMVFGATMVVCLALCAAQKQEDKENSCKDKKCSCNKESEECSAAAGSDGDERSAKI